MIMINDNKIIFYFFFSSIVIDVIETVLFFKKKRFLHKNKTHKYLNTPKKHNKGHSLSKKCLDKIANKKNNQ